MSTGDSFDDRVAAGGGESRPHPGAENPSLIRHEEEVDVGKRWEDAGRARIRRAVERDHVREEHPRRVERLAQERVRPNENDSGKIETLPDGSISVPLFEERLEVVRRTILRERVIVRRENVTEWQTVEAELRRERVAIDTGDAPRRGVGGIGRARSQQQARSAQTETKPFFLTSEFAVFMVALLGLLITTLARDSIDPLFFWAAATVLVAAYLLSRGSAKFATALDWWNGGSAS